MTDIKEEQYLTIKIVGHEPIKAWLNLKRPSDKHPNFKADGVAVWVNVKKKGEQKSEGETLLL